MIGYQFCVHVISFTDFEIDNRIKESLTKKNDEIVGKYLKSEAQFNSYGKYMKQWENKYLLDCFNVI